MIKVCPICGKEFKTCQARIDTNHGKYCSRECFEKGKIINRIKKHNYIFKEDYVEFTAYCKNKAYTCYIDKEDYDLIKNYNWNIYIATQNRNANYLFTRIKNKCIKLHRLITNCPINLQIDHINHNGLDNRKSNLRIVTQKENQQNLILQKNNTSGYTGVRKRKNGNWQVRIRKNNKEITLGTFKTFEEAVLVRKKAEKEVGIFYGT